VLQCDAAYYSVLQCVAVCCSVLQCVAVLCRVPFRVREPDGYVICDECLRVYVIFFLFTRT